MALWVADHDRKKAEHRKAKTKYSPFNRVAVSKKTSYREGLKNRLQREWRKLMYGYYSKIEYSLNGYRCTLADFCWIEKKRFFNPEGARKHIMSVAHVSHYYPKGEHYLMWTHPVNSGILGHNQNVNKQGNVIAMEPMMVYVWGEARVREMKEQAEHYRDQIRKGVFPSVPTNEWFLAEIEHLKKMTIS